ncbi:MAG: hypothetical protein HY814_10985 [Candidatus Riflebacteria bacterium]|nr:hypothetical protein [Candidatus Riflebacteria bacterium]
MRPVRQRIDWAGFQAALQRAAQRGHVNGEASTIDEFLRDLASQVPPDEDAARLLGRRALDRLGRVAARLFEHLPLVEQVLDEGSLEALLASAGLVLAEAGRRRHPDTAGARRQRLERLMAPILRHRVQGERTARLGTCEDGGEVCQVFLGKGTPPWVVAAVAPNGGVLAALETVGFDSASQRLELVVLAGAERSRVELELVPLSRGAPAIAAKSAGRACVAWSVELGRIYRLTLRSGRKQLGSGLVRFASSGEENPEAQDVPGALPS